MHDSQVQSYSYKHIRDTYVTSDEQLKFLLVVEGLTKWVYIIESF